MSGLPVPPIEAIGSMAHVDPVALQSPPVRTNMSFADMLTNGIDQVATKVDNADRLSRAFILDDSVPVHQVTFALEEARLSMELMMQVRNRLLEGYQQLMNMQL